MRRVTVCNWWGWKARSQSAVPSDQSWSRCQSEPETADMGARSDAGPRIGLISRGGLEEGTEAQANTDLVHVFEVREPPAVAAIHSYRQAVPDLYAIPDLAPKARPAS